MTRLLLNNRQLTGAIDVTDSVGGTQTVMSLSASPVRAFQRAIQQDINGYMYSSMVTATIPASRSVDLRFQRETLGPVECPIGKLSQIYTAVQG